MTSVFSEHTYILNDVPSWTVGKTKYVLQSAALVSKLNHKFKSATAGE